MCLPKRDGVLVLLHDWLVIVVKVYQYLHLGEIRHNSAQILIECEFPIFYQLEERSGCEKLGERGDPTE